MTSYDSTPTVLKKTTEVYTGMARRHARLTRDMFFNYLIAAIIGINYFEVDIDVYRFATLVKRTIHSTLSRYHVTSRRFICHVGDFVNNSFIMEVRG